MRFDDNEPIFKRSKWGTNRYQYNPQNPIGFALIIITIVFVGVMLLLMYNHAGPFAYPTDPTPAPLSTPTDMWRYTPPPDDGIPSGPPSNSLTP
ncbi:hypothetical protein [Streptomyces sp. NPDC005209]|uniref:hypothetical protein n=1 Tax=Streptomyces sp. NPDC005209 TaxID=3156715 RepID=UPI0033A0CB0D